MQITKEPYSIQEDQGIFQLLCLYCPSDIYFFFFLNKILAY